MKKFMLLILIAVGLLATACDKEETIVPTTADQIAEQILAINPSTVTIHSYSSSVKFEDVPYKVEAPFIIVEKDNSRFYYQLEKLIDMWYIKDWSELVLYFE